MRRLEETCIAHELTCNDKQPTCLRRREADRRMIHAIDCKHAQGCECPQTSSLQTPRLQMPRPFHGPHDLRDRMPNTPRTFCRSPESPSLAHRLSSNLPWFTMPKSASASRLNKGQGQHPCGCLTCVLSPNEIPRQGLDSFRVLSDFKYSIPETHAGLINDEPSACTTTTE